ncbi:hypothetical protein ABH972_000263 [Bradyrhizobium ottawaense]
MWNTFGGRWWSTLYAAAFEGERQTFIRFDYG